MDFLFALMVLVAGIAPFFLVAVAIELVWDHLNETQRKEILRKLGVK